MITASTSSFPALPAITLRHTSLLAVLWLLFSGCPSATRVTDRMPPPDLPIASEKLKEIRELVVLPDCGVEHPRESLIVVNWDKDQDGEAIHRIDLTPYAQGLEQDLFYTLIPRQDKSFTYTPKQGSIANLTKTLGGVRVRNFAPGKGTEGNRLSLGGLIPGMTYYLRVSTYSPNDNAWLPGQTLDFDAPVCPFDASDN